MELLEELLDDSLSLADTDADAVTDSLSGGGVMLADSELDDGVGVGGIGGALSCADAGCRVAPGMTSGARFWRGCPWGCAECAGCWGYPPTGALWWSCSCGYGE